MFTILHHEVKYYFKNKQEAISLYSYFASILLLIPFTQNINKVKIQELASLSLWIALASATALGAARLFKRDSEQGRLIGLQMLPMALEWVVLAKWLAFYGFIVLPLLAAIPLAGLLFQLDASQMLRQCIGLTAGAAALTAVATLVSTIASGLEKAGAILSLTILPLSIPVLIFGAQYSQSSGEIWQPNLVFLMGFTALIVPLACLIGAHSIRHSN